MRLRRFKVGISCFVVWFRVDFAIYGFDMFVCNVFVVRIYLRVGIFYVDILFCVRTSFCFSYFEYVVSTCR